MKIKNLVLSGGGIKGVAILGALKCLDDNDMLSDVTTIVGSSVGAVIGALIIIGYKPDELFNVMTSINPYDLKSIEPLKILTHYGIDSGAKIVKLLRTMISIKTGNPNLTFRDLHDNHNGKILTVTGTCIETGCIEYFGYETTPNVAICEALRLTISIPFIFSAVRFRNRTYVDGGILNNFPINLFDDCDEGDSVLGIRLVNDRGETEQQIGTLEQFAIGLVSGVINKIQDLTLENSTHKDRIIRINVGDISAIQFDIGQEKRQELYDIGMEAATNFIATSSTSS